MFRSLLIMTSLSSIHNSMDSIRCSTSTGILDHDIKLGGESSGFDSGRPTRDPARTLCEGVFWRSQMAKVQSHHTTHNLQEPLGWDGKAMEESWTQQSSQQYLVTNRKRKHQFGSRTGRAMCSFKHFEGSIFSDKPFDSWQDNQRDGKIKDDIRNPLTNRSAADTISLADSWSPIDLYGTFWSLHTCSRVNLFESDSLFFAKALTFGMRKIRRSNWWVLEGNLLKASLIFVVWFCIPRCQSRAKLY